MPRFFHYKFLHSILFERNYNRKIILWRLKHSKETCPSKEQKSGDCSCQSAPVPTKPCPRRLDELFNLNCKTTVVIGGEDGIGYATAHEILAKQAKVVGVFGNNVCKGMEACNALNCRFGKRKAVFFKVDVTNVHDLECAICKLTQDFGRIEAFVNAFAICDGKNWEKELNINLIGMARCTILAHKYLMDSKIGGVIVNTAGIFGMIPSAGCPTISAAQHGVIGLSKSFGREALFKHTKVRVVTLCPGLTKTKFFTKASKRCLTAFMGKCLKEEMEPMKKQRPEVCGQSVVWLLRFANSGSVWLIDGSELFKIETKLPHCCSDMYHQFPA